MKKQKAVLESEADVIAKPDTDLDLDDVAATRPKAKAEFEALRAENARLRTDAKRYVWLRDLLSVEDVDRLVNEHAQWSWCETDPRESVKTDAAVDKAMEG